MPNYICWTKHGKKGVIQEDDNEDEENMADFAQFFDTVMGRLKRLYRMTLMMMMI